MDILQALKDQRDRISQAIQVLDSDSTPTRYSSSISGGGPRGGPGFRKRRLSPAARRKISLAAKARWAKAKKAGRNRL